MHADLVQIPKTQPFKQGQQLHSISFQAVITPAKQIISLLEFYPVSSICGIIFSTSLSGWFLWKVINEVQLSWHRGTQAYPMEMLFWIEDWVTCSGICF